MVSDSKILEGYGKNVVIAIRQKPSLWSPDVKHSTRFTVLRRDPDPTPLQEKLNNLAELIAKIGGAAGLALFTALTIHFFVHTGGKGAWNQ